MKISRPKSKQEIPKHAKKMFDGVIFDIWQWEQELYDGSSATFEKIRRPDTVNVLPVTKKGEIVLTRQEQPLHEPFIGAPGGMVDPGEDVFTAAKREMLEESGYESDDWELLQASQLSSVMDWASYTFVAREAKKVAGLKLDAGEKIELMKVSFDEFVAITAQDNYRDFDIAMMVYRIQANGKLEELREKIVGKK